MSASLSIAIGRQLTATDIHFDYTSFDNPNNPNTTPHFGTAQFDVLNYPSINGNYMMTSTDAHRPEMVANGNTLAEFYNTLTTTYTNQAVKDGAAAANTINSYTVSNSTHNGPRPDWVVLNEISSSLWTNTTSTGTTYRQWLVDCVTRLHDVYNYNVVTFAPFQNPGANDATWQAVSAKSYIGIECYLSGPEVMAGGSDYETRLAWATDQYAASKQSYLNRGIPASQLFLGEHFGNTTAPNGFGRGGLESADDWDQVIQIRQDAIRAVGFDGFLAYSWGSNTMGITEAEMIQHEYYYRSRLVLPTQQPQWLCDDVNDVNGTIIPLSWSQPLNWIGGVPDAADAIANFYQTTTADRTITLDGSRTVGTLSFNSGYAYMISPGTGGTLTLSGATANVTVIQGAHTIATPIVLDSDVTFDIAETLSITAGMSDSSARTITRSGAGTLNLAGVQSYATGTVLNADAGTTNLNSNAGGGLTINANATVNFNASQFLAGLTIASGKTVTLTPGGAKTLNVGQLSVSGKLDLKDNDAIVRNASSGTWTGSAYTGVTGAIASGRNGGSWNGAAGIVSTSAGGITTLGVADASAIGITSTALWNGQSVSSSDVLVMYTYTGDANLDGKINILDYTLIDQGIAAGLNGWSNGDFNYDGKINILDYAMIDGTIGTQGPPLGSASSAESLAVSTVPEPTGAIIVLTAVLWRRRRTRAVASKAHG